MFHFSWQVHKMHTRTVSTHYDVFTFFPEKVSWTTCPWPWKTSIHSLKYFLTRKLCQEYNFVYRKRTLPSDFSFFAASREKNAPGTFTLPATVTTDDKALKYIIYQKYTEKNHQSHNALHGPDLPRVHSHSIVVYFPIHLVKMSPLLRYAFSCRAVHVHSIPHHLAIRLLFSFLRLSDGLLHSCEICM